jgi:hypothetical protein
MEINIRNLWNDAYSSKQMAKERLNWLMEFHDPNDQQAFVNFKAAQFDRSYFTYPFSIIVTLLACGYWAMVMINYDFPFSVSLLVYTFTITIPLLWIVTLVKQRSTELRNARNYPTKYCYLENMFMIFATINCGLIVVMRAVNGHCINLLFYNVFSCSPAYAARGVPPDIYLIALFMPLLCFKTFPSIKPKIVFLLYLFNLGVIVFAAVINSATNAVSWIITSWIIVLLVHYISSWNQVQLFLYFLKSQELQKKMQENKQMR